MLTSVTPVNVPAANKTTTEPVVFLTPSRITRMLQERQSYQIIKFRTNCSDCVPNL